MRRCTPHSQNSAARVWCEGLGHLPYPEADVMAPGDSTDRPTFHRCYQHADKFTMIAVVECPNKLMSQVSAHT